MEALAAAAAAVCARISVDRCRIPKAGEWLVMGNDDRLAAVTIIVLLGLFAKRDDAVDGNLSRASLLASTVVVFP